HGAVKHSHGPAHDLDDGGSDVPRSGRAGDPCVADPADSHARPAARRVALAASPSADLRATHLGAVYRNAVRPVLLAVLRDLAQVGILACVSASALPDHWLPADVAIDGDRSRSREDQSSAAAADAVPDAPLPCIPWHFDHELDHVDRGELVSRGPSALADPK